jgi:hypothetical protein
MIKYTKIFLEIINLIQFLLQHLLVFNNLLVVDCCKVVLNFY